MWIFVSKNISIYAIFNVQNFSDTLTNDIVSFEQLGPETRVYLSISELTITNYNWQYMLRWSLMHQKLPLYES